MRAKSTKSQQTDKIDLSPQNIFRHFSLIFSLQTFTMKNSSEKKSFSILLNSLERIL
jgi:hypothetical protein